MWWTSIFTQLIYTNCLKIKKKGYENKSIVFYQKAKIKSMQMNTANEERMEKRRKITS